MSEQLFVYVIGQKCGPQKVGFSNDPMIRARALKVSGEPHLSVHYQHRVPKDDAPHVERLAHWLLRDTALGHERFNVTPIVAAEAVKNAVSLFAEGRRAPQREGLHSERVQIIMAPNEVREVEEWCKRQAGRAPTFSEAVRYLTERGMKADEDDKRRK